MLEYQAKFQELKFLMLNRNPFLTEEYFVSSFAGGLNDELTTAVHVLQPSTVQEATEGAFLQEMTFEALLKKQRGQNRGAMAGAMPYGGRPTGKELMRTGPGVRYPALPLVSQNFQKRDKLLEQRRLAGLCIKCGDKYTPGHQCKKQLLLLEGGEEEEEEEMEVIADVHEEDNGAISLHAIKGVASSKIIKVEGRAQEGTLMVLIDKGSTHSFIDEGTTKKMKYPLANTQLLSVTMANGEKVISKSACLGFCWEMQGELFETNMRLLKLGGYHIVLGVDWMKGVNPISFDFNKIEVSLEKEGRRVILQGNLKMGTCKLISGEKLHQLFRKKVSQVDHLFAIEAREVGVTYEEPEEDNS